MRRGGVLPVSSIIQKVAKRYGFEKQLILWKIRKVWVERFGKFSKFVMPEDYKRHTIYLHTESPVWKTELTYLKEEIIETLSPHLDVPVKNVVIKVAPFRCWGEEID